MTRLPCSCRPLGHPLWWVSLVVLIGNDHVLKGQAWLPAVLTGKLSDFAGLIVAPVLAAVLIRARSTGARAAAFAAVALIFCAIKTSAHAAHALEWIMGLVHVPWRLWVDPTDLLALSMLPVAWWIASGNGRVRGKPWLDRVAVMAGALACVATSVATGDRLSLTAYLVNATPEVRTVRLHRVTNQLACNATPEEQRALLGPDQFTLESCTSLEFADVLPLGRVWRDLTAGKDAGSAPAAAPEPVCDAVVVEADGLEPMLLYWADLARKEIEQAPSSLADEHDDPQAVLLEAAGARLFIQGTSLIHAWPAGFTLPGAACPATGGVSP